MKYLILASLLVLGGCGSVSNQAFSVATKLCKEHKGLDYIKTQIYSARVEAYCKDGLYIEKSYTKGEE